MEIKQHNPAARCLKKSKEKFLKNYRETNENENTIYPDVQDEAKVLVSEKAKVSMVYKYHSTY